MLNRIAIGALQRKVCVVLKRRFKKAHNARKAVSEDAAVKEDDEKVEYEAERKTE